MWCLPKMTFPLYVNKEFMDCFNTLRVKCSIDDTKISTAICRAIQKYILFLTNRKDIIIPQYEWKSEIDKMTDDELKNLDTLISGLHDTILDTLWKKK